MLVVVLYDVYDGGIPLLILLLIKVLHYYLFDILFTGLVIIGLGQSTYFRCGTEFTVPSHLLPIPEQTSHSLLLCFTL